MEFKHTSVLLEETIENLNIRPDGVYADGTLGGAGHASEVCKRLSATGRFFGIDQDEAAIKAAGERLAVFGDRGNDHPQQLPRYGPPAAAKGSLWSGRDCS